MNKTLIFFCLSTSILALSLIVACISPIINNFTVEGKEETVSSGSTEPESWVWKISDWRILNCKRYEDLLNKEDVNLDDIQKYKKVINLCKSKKAMHDLEFASLFINLVLGFVCANLSLLHFLDVGKDFEKKTGIIGFITGIIGFILTLVYVCFNGFIFNNDIAYGFMNGDKYEGRIKKLYSNGAIYKCEDNTCNPGVSVYENDKSDFSEFVKYKDLGDKQYNYDSKYYKSYYTTTSCRDSDSHAGCTYIFPNNQYTQPIISFENKDLHDRWATTLILSIFIVACNIGLLIFGFLLFKGGSESNEPKTVEIQ